MNSEGLGCENEYAVSESLAQLASNHNPLSFFWQAHLQGHLIEGVDYFIYEINCGTISVPDGLQKSASRKSEKTVIFFISSFLRGFFPPETQNERDAQCINSLKGSVFS